MSVYCIIHQTLRLSDPTRKIQLREPLAYNNAQAHSFRVSVINDDGTDADLTGVGCVGAFMKGNNETVTPINGTISGSTAEIVLPASCYATPGRFKFTMNLGQATSPEGIDNFSTSTSYSKGDLVVYNNVVYRFTEDHAAGAWTGTDAVPDGSSRTVLWVEGMVERNSTETIVDPGTPVGNITQAISNANAAAAAATGAASAANTAATAAQGAAAQAVGDIANTYDSTHTYEVGDYVINSTDGKLYRCNTAITTAEEWTAAHWDWVALANDVAAIAKIQSSNAEFNAVLNALDGTIRQQYLFNANMTDNRYWKLEDGVPTKTGTSSTAQKCWEPFVLPAGTYTYYRIVGSYSYVDDGESITKLRTTTGTNTDPITVTFDGPVTVYISASNTNAGNGAMLCNGTDVPTTYTEGAYDAELARIDAVEDDVSDLKSAVGDLEVPALPSADGNYTLRLTVSGGAATYSWVAE